jgi:SpoVK/Ycf46/Vps4 family AAA+-type ATPase
MAGQSDSSGEDATPTVTRQPPPASSFDDLSGLGELTDNLTEAVITPITDDRLDSFGASGILLHGPSGVGKTYVARALIGELGMAYVDVTPAKISLSRPDVAARYIEALDRVARENEPCALLVDELDVIAPARDTDEDRSEQVIAELYNLLDHLDNRDQQVLFVGTTAKLGDIDDRVRRAGRIDLTFALERPDYRRRCAIIADELRDARDAGVELGEITIEHLAGWTDGFSAAEIVEVVQRAVRKSPTAGVVDEVPFAEAVDELHDVDDFLASRTDDDGEQVDTHRTATGEVPMAEEDDPEDGTDPGPFPGDGPPEEGGLFGRDSDRGSVIQGEDTPDVSFDDIGGLDRTKQRLREVVEWPRRYPGRFQALDVDTAKGILLYGPPGTGKTLLAKAIAAETDSTFISVDGPEVLDRYVGESERFVRQLFAAAEDVAPTVVFVDEIDAIAGSRGGYTGGGGVQDTIVNQLLSEMDGLTALEDVVIVGATNRVEVIDPALRRSGRFGEAIHVPPPDDEGRREVFEIHTAGRALAEDVDVDWLVDRTDTAYTGADVKAICERAAMNAIRDSVERDPDGDRECLVTREHFLQAIRSVDPGGDRESVGGDPTFL